MERKLVVDDRKSINPFLSGRPWTAVGLVETEGQSCTGVLVGPDLLLTTQCCGLNRQPDGSIGWLRFTPAKYDGKYPFGTASGKWWFWHYNDIGKKAETSFELAFNYVLVKLDWRIGDKVGWWCFKHLDCPDSWSGLRKIGYASDLNNKVRPYVTENPHTVLDCEWHTNSDGARSVRRNTDIWAPLYGKSGDVIFGMIGDTYCAVGLSTSVYSCKETGFGDGTCSQASGGPALEELIGCVNRETALCGHHGTVTTFDHLLWKGDPDPV
eukprot:scaffold12758_cov121-Skeletonema_dohrnii-CCMP3373.AAC.1